MQNTPRLLVLLLTSVSAIGAQTPMTKSVEYEPISLGLVNRTRPVTCLTVASDDSLCAAGDAGGRIRVYDQRKGTLLKTCDLESPVSAAVLIDDSLLATADFQGVVRLFRFPELQPIAQLRGHTKPVLDLAVSADGKRLLSCGYDKTVRFWDVADRREIHRIADHGATVRAVACSSDGRWFASVGDDRTVRLWDATTFSAGTTFRGHTARILDVAFSPDSTRIASCDEGAETLVHRIDEVGKPVRRSGSTAAHCLAFSGNGQLLAVGHRNGAVEIMDLTGKVVRSLGEHSDVVTNICFLKSDQSVLTAGLDGRLQSLRALLPAAPATRFVNAIRKTWAVSIDPTGRMCASAGRRGLLELRNLDDGELVRQITEHPATVDCLAFAADGQLIAANGWRSPTVVCWNPGTGKEQFRFDADSNVRAVTFSPDGTRLAAGSDQGQLTLYDVKNRRVLQQQTITPHAIYDLKYSPDGSRLATCSGRRRTREAGTIRLWDPEPLALHAEFRPGEFVYGSLSFSPDGRSLATVGDGDSTSTILIHDLATQSSAGEFQSVSRVRCVCYSPDSQLLATGLEDGTIWIRDAVTGKVRQRLRGGRDLFSLAWSPDGSTIVGAGGEIGFHVWEISGKTRPPAKGDRQ